MKRYADGLSGTRLILTFLPIRLSATRVPRSWMLRALEHDAVLDLRVADLDVVHDRGERPDVGVHDARVRRR